MRAAARSSLSKRLVYDIFDFIRTIAIAFHGSFEIDQFIIGGCHGY
jgi:hypothetical protein